MINSDNARFLIVLALMAIATVGFLVALLVAILRSKAGKKFDGEPARTWWKLIWDAFWGL